ELIQTYGASNVCLNPDAKYPGGMLSHDPAHVQRTFGGRWLTTDFRAGDVLIIPMFTLHCSLDNRSPRNRLRVSSDSRYQLASEPMDERMIGDDPSFARPPADS